MSGEPKDPKNMHHGERDPATRDDAGRADAPEAHNAEQADEEAQAQSVAEDALAAAGSGEGLSDSRKSTSGDETDDVQDVVDHMVQMDRSGQVDMDAYRGERSDDDEEGALGPDGVERSAPRGAE